MKRLKNSNNNGHGQHLKVGTFVSFDWKIADKRHTHVHLHCDRHREIWIAAEHERHVHLGVINVHYYIDTETLTPKDAYIDNLFVIVDRYLCSWFSFL